MARTLIVTTLHISEPTAEKLREKHDLDPEAVRAAIQSLGPLDFSWHTDHRGSRALIWTVVDDEAVLVVLYPTRSGDAEEWDLGSAYRDHQRA